MMVDITNKHGLPEPLVDYIRNSEYSAGESDRSATTLIDSPRVRILKQEHADDISYDVSELIAAKLGTAFHEKAQQFGMTGALPEELGSGPRFTPESRFFTTAEGWLVSGQVDLLEVVGKRNGRKQVILWDYKTCSVWAVIHGKKEWEEQLNFYAYLVEEYDHYDRWYPDTGDSVRRMSTSADAEQYEVVGLKVCAIMKDWSKTQRRNKGGDYPEAGAKVVDVPLWDQKKRSDYVQGRVTLHQQAEFERLTGNTLPACTPEERWQQTTTYAVKKGKNKRALRVFPRKVDAAKYIEARDDSRSLKLEVREGRCVRCEDWCSVSEFCDQWQMDKFDNDLKAGMKEKGNA